MSRFSDNLNDLLVKSGITKEGLARKLGISHTTVSRWKHGALPRPALLKRIAEEFGVQVSDLIGDAKPESTGNQMVRFIVPTGEFLVSGTSLTVRLVETDGKNVPHFELRRAIEEAGFSQNGFARMIKISPQTLNRALVHHQMPYPATLKKIADFFGISVATVKPSFTCEAPEQPAEVGQ